MARTKQTRNKHNIRDKKEVIEVARKNPRFSLKQHADPSLWSDRDVVLAAVAANGSNLMQISEDLRMDPEIVSVAVTANGLALAYAPDKFKSDPAIVTAAVKSCGMALSHVQGDLRDDPKIVWLAIENSGSSLEFVSDQFKDDKELVLTALKVGRNKASPRGAYTILNYASDRLRGDRDVVRYAIQHCGGLSLRFASMALQADRELVLAAIDSNAGALEYASPALQADREVVLRAVTQLGSALYHASQELRGDRDIATAAVNAPNGNSPGCALAVVSEALRGDREFVLHAVTISGSALRFASLELRGDREVVETALQNRKHIRASGILEYASEELRGDRQLIRQGIQDDSLTLHFASKNLQLDPDMVALAWETTREEHDFDLFFHFERDHYSGSKLRSVYLDYLVSIHSELKKGKKHTQFYVGDPHASVQLAEKWLSDCSEKAWLTGELAKAKGFPDLCSPIVAFAGLKEDMQLASRLLRFSSILHYFKEGMERNHADEDWEDFVSEASRLIW